MTPKKQTAIAAAKNVSAKVAHAAANAAVTAIAAAKAKNC